MQELRAIAAGDAIRGFITDPPYLLGPDFVQGVNLLIDPFWLRYYRATFAFYTDEVPLSGSFRTHKIVKGKELDFSWRPCGWPEHCSAVGYQGDGHPVVVQILLRKPAPSGLLAEAPREIAGHPIVYTERDSCVAFASDDLRPGAKVGRVGPTKGMETEGTLGGFLRDSQTGGLYAVSCAHVMGNLGAELCRAAGGPTVADVRLSVSPPPSGPATKCNRVAQMPALDVALAELRPGVATNATFDAAGLVRHVTPVADLTSDDPVVFRRRHRRRFTSAKIGPLNVWREVLVDNQTCCMGDMMIIQPLNRSYVRTSLARGGDSGSWVLSRDNQLLAWDGMVVAGDGPDVYCAFAQEIVAQCQGFMPSLALPA